MPSEVALPAQETGIQVRLSPINELIFALFILSRTGAHGKWTQPWLSQLREQEPELIERVGTFWGDSLPEWVELGVYAGIAGALWDADPGRLIARVAQIAARDLPRPALESEAEDVREVVYGRMDRLRASGELRERYAAILREVWERLEPFWDRAGRKAANDLAQDMRRRMDAGADFRDLLPAKHFARREGHAELVQESLQRGQLVLVPLGLAGIGMGMLDLPGALVVTVGPESEKNQHGARERAEQAAARFKVLSDPTRLAMLTSLISYPASISELATYFEVSQPTASVHVKMLREAGLLEWERVRGQTTYRAKPETVRAYVEAVLPDIADEC